MNVARDFKQFDRDLLPETAPARTTTLIRRTMAEAGFPPIPIKNAVLGDRKTGKTPKGLGWQKEARSPVPECTIWDEADGDALNTGVLCDGNRVVDIDVDDAAKADRIERCADDRLGTTPCIRRREDTGRRALLYRAAEGTPGKLDRSNSSTSEKVEILGYGQQLVVYGEHYSGTAILWSGAPGLEVDRSDLSPVTEAQIEAFLDDVTEIIGADPPRSYTPLDASDLPSNRSPEQDALTREDVVACLALIPDGPRDWWRDIAAAVRAWDAGWEGLEVFDDWSRTGCYGGRQATEEMWQGVKDMREIGVGSLIYWAKQADPDFVLPSRQHPVVPGCIARNIETSRAQVQDAHDRHAAYLERQATAPSPAPKRRFRMLRCTEAASLPAPQFLVPGLIVEQSIGAIYGPSGSLKSFLMLDVCLSLGHGLPWCGQPLERSVVIYVAAEGAHGLGLRIDAWKRLHGVNDIESEFILIPEGVNLMDPQCMADLTQEIAEECEARGLRPSLVLLDTLATCAVGMEENSGKETGLAVGAMSIMRHVLGCAVFCVHHTGKNVEGGMRGSYRLQGDLDCVIEVSRGADEARMNMSTHIEKQKDGSDGTALHFTARPYAWWKSGTGYVSTLVIEPREEHFGTTPVQHSKVLAMREDAVKVLEVGGKGVTRRKLCTLAGWGSGRVNQFMPMAFPPEGTIVTHPVHGEVRISMVDDLIYLTEDQ